MRRAMAFFFAAAAILVMLTIVVVYYLFSSSTSAARNVAKRNAEEVMENRVENIITRIDTLRSNDEVTYQREISRFVSTASNLPEEDLLSTLGASSELLVDDPDESAPYVEVTDARGTIVWTNGSSVSAPNVLDLQAVDVGSYHVSVFITQDAIDARVKSEIRGEIYSANYGQNQYVWVNEVVNYDGGDDYAIRRIHPNLSSTEGQYLSTNIEDAVGNHPYESELEGIKANGSIFQSYYFENMSDKQIALKYSYAKLYEPYNWIIATGIPLSDLYSVANEQSSQDQQAATYVIALVVVVLLLLAGVGILQVRKNVEVERGRETERDLALRFEGVLLDEIRLVDEPTGLSSRMSHLVGDIGTCFGADRVHIYSIIGGNGAEAYEWHREGLGPSSDATGTNHDGEAIPWVEVIERRELMQAADIKRIKSDHPWEYAALTRLGVRSFVLAPVIIDDKVTNLIAVANPGKDGFRYLGPFLLALSPFVADAMVRSQDERVQRTKYELAVETAGIGIFEYHLKDSRIDLPGDRHKDCGLPDVLEGVPGSLLPFVDEADRGRAAAFCERMREGASSGEESFWVRWQPDMAPRYERVVFTTQRNAAGEPVTAFGIMQNVTRQKSAEQRYAHMVSQITDSYPNNLAASFLNLTKDVCVEVRSPYGWVSELGADGTVDGVISGVAERIVDEGERRRFLSVATREAMLSAFAEGRTSYSVDYPILASDGRSRWLRAWVYMLENPNTGDVEAHTSTVAIDEERSEELMVRSLTREVYGFVILLDTDTGRIRFGGDTSTGAEQYHDQDYGPACEAALREMMSDDQLEEAMRLHSLETIRAELSRRPSYEVTLTTRDGRTLHWLMTYVDEERSMVLIARSDVTEAVETERRRVDELREALDRAEEATAAEQRFLSSMSHDLRTPLNGIIGFADLALDATDDAKRRDYLEKTARSGRLMLDLVNDILDLSKLESGKMDLRPETCDSRELFSAMTESVSLSAEQRNVSFQPRMDEGYPRYVLVDRLRLQQIALNLLSNSIKYTPDGGEVRFDVDMVDGTTTHMRVADNGIGMSKEFQGRMFEPFSQEHQSRLYGVQGTGLGLSIVRSLVDLMGGRIEVESELGKGTTFDVYLELPPVEESKVGDARRSVAPTRSITGRRVLLCEDNSLNAEIATAFLRDRAGVEVSVAHDGKEGLDLFCASAPGTFDAILMDLRMPVMDGIAATKAIRGLERSDARSIPIVAMTADAFEEDVRRCAEAGMDAHVAKPIDPSELIVATLAELIPANR